MHTGLQGAADGGEKGRGLSASVAVSLQLPAVPGVGEHTCAGIMLAFSMCVFRGRSSVV